MPKNSPRPPQMPAIQRLLRERRSFFSIVHTPLAQSAFLPYLRPERSEVSG
jgi:hypothetical protein